MLAVCGCWRNLVDRWLGNADLFTYGPREEESLAERRELQRARGGEIGVEGEEEAEWWRRAGGAVVVAVAVVM